MSRALLLDFLEDRISKTSDSIELRLFQELQQFFKLVFGLSRKSHDEGGADRDFRANLAPFANSFEIALAVRGPFISFKILGLEC